MSEELALGQREVPEVSEGFEFSADELTLITANNSTPEEVLEFVRTSGVQTLNAALGGIAEAKAGSGQERNEPFQTQAEADAQVSGEPSAEVSVESSVESSGEAEAPATTE